MIEPVTTCVKCNKEITCNGGFLNGIVLNDSTVLCFSCYEKEKTEQGEQH